MLVFALEHLATHRPTVPACLPSLALALIAAVTALALVLSHPDKRPHGDIYLQHDHHDDTLAEPEHDDEADPAAFYPRQRTLKLATAASLVSLLALELFRAAWEATAIGPNLYTDWIDRLGPVALWATAAALSIASLPLSNSKRDIDLHWRYTIAVFTLASAALLVALLRLVLPRSTGLSLLPDPALPAHLYTAQLALALTALLLTLAAFLLSGSTPRCAPLVHPTSRRPVVSLPSCSPLTYLVFAWITPVLRSSYTSASLDAATLPALPAADRARTLWDQIRRSAPLAAAAPRGWNRLLYRLVRINARLFAWQVALSVVNAVLYYVPAFFLQRLVRFLEQRGTAEEQSMQWAYVYVVGLFAGAVIESLVEGQLWFVSNSLLATRIRVQLNTLIFDKTLKRKDVANLGHQARSSSGPSSADAPSSSSSSGRAAGAKSGAGGAAGKGNKLSPNP
ncbi:hypothetical protein JCM3770_000322, partial [Rhodotorula araucariae]